MKKFNLKNKPLIMIIGVVILIIVSVLMFLIGKMLGAKKENIIKENNLNEQTTVFINKPYKNAKKITSKKLSKEHCLNDICIKDLVIYYTDESNNIELKVVNKGKKPATGYLKIVFGEKAMTVAYNSLDKKKSSPYTIQLGKEKLPDISDFTVRKLTSGEMSKIKK